MSLIDAAVLDGHGKVDLSKIYVAEDPADYYFELSRLDYVIAEVARPVCQRLYAARRALTGRGRLNVLDVGCSYGVSAALQHFGLSWSEFVARYAGLRANGLIANEMALADRAFFDNAPEHEAIDFTGLDVSAPAIDYAVAAGLLRDGYAEDLETGEPSEGLRAAADAADVILATGAVGYVTERTFAKLGPGTRAPWLVLFVLRQFSVQRIVDAFECCGYVCETVPELIFPQRRFAGPEERAGAFERLRRIGREPTDLERSGWFAAELFVLRPALEAQAFPLARLLAPDTLPTGAAR